jgi:hypothetical protein
MPEVRDLSADPELGTTHALRDAAPPSTPRWVKVLAIAAIALVLIFVSMHLTGQHGPMDHMPPTHQGMQHP